MSVLNVSSDDTSTDEGAEKNDMDVFSIRAEQFAEDHSLFLREIAAEQLSLLPSQMKKLKLPPAVQESIQEFLWNPALKADQLITFMTSKFPLASAGGSHISQAHTLQVRWLGVHPNYIELIVESVRFVHAAFGQDHLREPRTLRSEFDRLLKLHSTASTKVHDSQTEVILSWWFPQLIELLALLRLKGCNTRLKDASPPAPGTDITNAFLKCYDAFEANSILALYLLSGEYLSSSSSTIILSTLPPPSSSSSSSSSTPPLNPTSTTPSSSPPAFVTISPRNPQQTTSTPNTTVESSLSRNNILDGGDLSLDRRYNTLRERSRKHTDFLRKTVTQAYTELPAQSQGLSSSRSLQSLTVATMNQNTHELKPSLSSSLEGLLMEDNYAVILALGKIKLLKDGGDELCKAILSFYKLQYRLIPLLSTAISVEISETTVATSLFRGESPATKLMSTHLYDNGLDYLRFVTHYLILEIVVNNQDLEIDPQKATPGTDVVANLEKVLVLTQDFLKTLFKSVDHCPISFRQLFAHTQREVQNRFPEMKQLAVGAFLFLRFICPALVTPERYGLLPNENQIPTTQARRGLILISKVLQNLANNVEFDGTKEEYMRSLNRLITRNMESVRRFFDDLADETRIGNRAADKGGLYPSVSASISTTSIKSDYALTARSTSTANAQATLPRQTFVVPYAPRAEDELSAPVVSKVADYLRGGAISCIFGSLMEPGVSEGILEHLKKRSDSAHLRFRSFLLKQSPSIIKTLIHRQDVLSNEIALLTARLGPENSRKLLGFQLRAHQSQLFRSDSEHLHSTGPTSIQNAILEGFYWDLEAKEIENQVNSICSKLPPGPQRTTITTVLKRIFKLHHFIERLHCSWPSSRHSKSKTKSREFKDCLARQLMVVNHLWHSVCDLEIPFNLPDVWTAWNSFKGLFEAGFEFLNILISINPLHHTGRDSLAMLVVQTKWTISRIMELQLFVKPIEV